MGLEMASSSETGGASVAKCHRYQPDVRKYTGRRSTYLHHPLLRSFPILVTFLFTILVLVFVIGVLITAVLCIDARVLSSRDRVNGLSPLSPSPLIDMSSSRSSSSSLSSSSDPASLPDSSSCSDPESAAASADAFLLRRGATSRSFLSARF